MIFLITTVLLILFISFVVYKEPKPKPELDEMIIKNIEKFKKDFKNVICRIEKRILEGRCALHIVQKDLRYLYSLDFNYIPYVPCMGIPPYRVQQFYSSDEYIKCLGLLFEKFKIPYEACNEKGIKPSYKDVWIRNGDDMAKELPYLYKEYILKEFTK